MKLFKSILLLGAAMLFATTVYADTTPPEDPPASDAECTLCTGDNCTGPEIDAVGDDTENIFIKYSSINAMVMDNVTGETAIGCAYINDYSDFSDIYFVNHCDETVLMEDFTYLRHYPTTDCCFNVFDNYMSVPAIDLGNSYEWWIVLQQTPRSDLDIEIYDCVTSSCAGNIFTTAQQTGRYYTPATGYWFIPSWNPRISVKAYPGEDNYFRPFYMDARNLGCHNSVCLDEVLYSSKALFSENILVKHPKAGHFNSRGECMVQLIAGDRIRVNVDVPESQNLTVRYGQDNVLVKYVGDTRLPYIAIP